jgi:hypothetical protein
MSDGENDPKQEAMYKEEEKLRKQSEREAQRNRERGQQDWEKDAGDKNYLKDLDWFLSRSQVGFPCPLGSGILFATDGLIFFRASLRPSWTS